MILTLKSNLGSYEIRIHHRVVYNPKTLMCLEKLLQVRGGGGTDERDFSSYQNILYQISAVFDVKMTIYPYKWKPFTFSYPKGMVSTLFFNEHHVHLFYGNEVNNE